MVQWLGFNTFTAMAPRLNPWSGNRSCKLHEAAPKKQESQERRCKTNKKPKKIFKTWCWKNWTATCKRIKLDYSLIHTQK